VLWSIQFTRSYTETPVADRVFSPARAPRSETLATQGDSRDTRRFSSSMSIDQEIFSVESMAQSTYKGDFAGTGVECRRTVHKTPLS
jgi:hypothetical protein